MIQISRTRSCLILTMILVLGAATISPATPPPNPLHPTFQLLDPRGKIIRQAGMEPDQEKTCGQCHDTAFITGHTIPAHQQKNISCLSCHFECDKAIECGKVTWSAEAFEPDGMLKRQWLRISKPASANCGTCHGLTTPPDGPVAIPKDYRIAAYPTGSQTSEHHQLTRNEGSIYSAQDVSESLLNLAGRQNLHFPWDVHARKVVQCTDCHYAPNDPQRLSSQTKPVALLRSEPRREKLSEYLQQPDHRLRTADCQTCHDPLKGHDFLPYPARHFEMVACQSCHVPRQMGPAEQMVDATLLDESGSPLVTYQGVKGEPANLNTVYTEGSVPPLLPLKESGKSGNSVRLTPVNLVSRWYWTSGDSQEPIAREVLERALMNNGLYRPELIAALDQNHDGRLDRSELKLDTESKRQVVEQLLVAAGVKRPAIRSEVKLHPLGHGVSGRSQALSDCAACHGPDSRLKDQVVLASWTPGGQVPPWKDGKVVPGDIETTAKGGLVWKAGPEVQDRLHLLGFPAQNWSDRLGLLMLLGVVLGVTVHGGYRLISRRRHPPHVFPTRREYIFTAYERLWHWVMAVSVIALILTGLQIHFPGRLNLFGAARAVSIHNFFAVVLTLNAFLALFYHLATAAIRQFLPERQGLTEELTRQTKYYLRDIFKGLPAPFRRSPDRKLNVLQQITYFTLLNVLFPLQIITGALIWLVGTYPAWATAVGGLSLIAPLHNLGSWMFLSFLVMHLYLATAGHTVLAHVRGMIDGYEEVEVADLPEGERV
jgi:thiosulfate reductase cytochrome b subunit/mono/diheme cytochrome c family protein